jgi:hypothetical protein
MFLKFVVPLLLPSLIPKKILALLALALAATADSEAVLLLGGVSEPVLFTC